MASRLFFWLTISFFVLQSAWIAFSALYPQAFDEQFHFGIIQVYAHQWLPFLRSQPPNADPYGAVARDPSFFYHYIMSFPYRLIALFTHDQTVQIISLRLINVALFAAGLVLFHRVLRRTGLSNLATNVCTFMVTLIPVAPQLAGQINYDNLLIPMTACACLLTFNLIDQLRQRRFTVQAVLQLLAVCLLASIVKYEFLPIFLGIVIFLGIFAWRQLHGHWNQVGRSALRGWRKAGRAKWLMAAGFVAALTLFAQRDVGNVMLYHTVVPDCSQVLNIQHCSAYSVWIHDYKSHQAVVSHAVHANPNPVSYLGEWIYWLWYRLFFAINGSAHNFRNYPPLPLPAAMFAVLVVAGTVALVTRGRRTFADKPYLTALGIIVVIYLVTLLAAGYQKYLQTGVLELMNGRYLFPILLPGAAVAAPALIALARRLPQSFCCGLVLVILLAFLDGGGMFTFIARSDHTWYWPNATVQHVNKLARRIVKPLVFDGPNTYATHHWFFN